MRTVVTAFISFFCVGSVAIADDLNLHAWQMESKGDPAGAREFLERSPRKAAPRTRSKRMPNFWIVITIQPRVNL